MEMDISPETHPATDPAIESEGKGKKKRFRFKNKYALLTYKGHLDKEKFKEWAHLEFGVADVHVAHETGVGDEHHPYKHTHVLLEWEEQFQTQSERRFDCMGIHPNVNPIRSREHLMNSMRYMCKEDHSCDYLLEKRSSAFSKRVWKCATVSDALAQVEKPSDVLGTVVMWKNRPREPYIEEIPRFREWQAWLLKYVSLTDNDREIIWVCDEVGGGGKSRLCKYLMTHKLAYCVTSLGSIKDIAQILKGALDDGWDLSWICIDLPRDAEHKGLYEPLEMIKNGMITSAKYEGRTLIWKPGHVVVFANFPPQKDRMTEDRWKVITLSKRAGRLTL